LYNKKLDIKDVEEFEGMMKDCKAEHGILVCPMGYSGGAFKRAQDTITIRLLTFEELNEQSVWANYSKCIGKCQNSK